MQEVLSYLRANGFKTYIVTGGGQDFVRDAEREYMPMGLPRGFRTRRSAPSLRRCSMRLSETAGS
jgi:hypothetical protein